MAIHRIGVILAALCSFAALYSTPAHAQWIRDEDFPEPPSDFQDVTLECRINGNGYIGDGEIVPTAPITLVFGMRKIIRSGKTHVVIKTLAVTEGRPPTRDSITGMSPTDYYFNQMCLLTCYARVVEELVDITPSSSMDELLDEAQSSSVSINRFSGEYRAYQVTDDHKIVEKGTCTKFEGEKMF